MTIDLDYLQRLCDAATEGPWEIRPNEPFIIQHGWGGEKRVCEIKQAQNVPFIAEARTAIPELIAEVRRLKEKCNEY